MAARARGRAPGAQRDHARGRRHGHPAPHGGADRVARPDLRQDQRSPRHGHAGRDRPRDDLVAERHRDRLGAGHVGLCHRTQVQQQPRGRLSRQHARSLRQPARGVPRRVAHAHPRRGLQRRHRHDRRRHRRHARRQRRAHLVSRRLLRHRHAARRRTRGQRRVGAAGRRVHLLPAGLGGRHPQGRSRSRARVQQCRLRRAAHGRRREDDARRGAAEGAARAVPPPPHVGGVRQGGRGPLQRRARARTQPGRARPADVARHDARWPWPRSRRTRPRAST